MKSIYAITIFFIYWCVNKNPIDNKRIHYFEKQIDSLSRNPELDSNNYINILYIYDSLIKYNKENVMYNYGKAKCYINLEKYETAIAEADKGLKVQDENTSLLILKSMLLKRIGKYNEFKKCIEKAELILNEKNNSNIRNPNLINDLLFVLVLQGKKAEAIDISNKINDLNEREFQIDFINSIDTAELSLP